MPLTNQPKAEEKNSSGFEKGTWTLLGFTALKLLTQEAGAEDLNQKFLNCLSDSSKDRCEAKLTNEHLRQLPSTVFKEGNYHNQNGYQYFLGDPAEFSHGLVGKCEVFQACRENRNIRDALDEKGKNNWTSEDKILYQQVTDPKKTICNTGYAGPQYPTPLDVSVSKKAWNSAPDPRLIINNRFLYCGGSVPISLTQFKEQITKILKNPAKKNHQQQKR